MPLLRISALHKYYGDHHVLKGIDLTVEEGQVVAIIGRSGSGKARCCARSTALSRSTTA